MVRYIILVYSKSNIDFISASKEHNFIRILYSQTNHIPTTELDNFKKETCSNVGVIEKLLKTYIF